MAGVMACVTTVLNLVAILGWAVVLITCTIFPVNYQQRLLWRMVFFLECICCYEVVRMMMGSIKGNVALGIPLHYTRMLLLVGVLPRISVFSNKNNWIVATIFIAWSATEVCRYGHYLARLEVL